MSLHRLRLGEGVQRNFEVRTHTHTHSLTHSLTHSHTHSHTHTLTHSHTHTLTHSHTHTHTLTHTLTHSLTHTHTHTHTLTHTHTHSLTHSQLTERRFDGGAVSVSALSDLSHVLSTRHSTKLGCQSIIHYSSHTSNRDSVVHNKRTALHWDGLHVQQVYRMESTIHANSQHCKLQVSYRIFFAWGGKYTHWPKVLRSLAHPPAQGAGFPNTPAGPRCWVP